MNRSFSCSTCWAVTGPMPPGLPFRDAPAVGADHVEGKHHPKARSADHEAGGGAVGRNRGAVAGPTTSVTKFSPACSNSTAREPKRSD